MAANRIAAAASKHVAACEETDIGYGAALLQRHQNNEFCDVNLYGNCPNGNASALSPIPAHKVLLASASPLFRAAFTAQGFIDSNAKDFSITSIEHATVEVIIHYVYNSTLLITVDDDVEKRIESVLVGADYLLMPELVRICGRALDKPAYLKVSNCTGKWLFARKHHCKNLEAAAIRVAVTDLAEVAKQQEFLTMKKKDFVALLKSLVISTVHPDTLCDVAIACLEFDPSKRKSFSSEIFAEIPLDKVSSAVLQNVFETKKGVLTKEVLSEMKHVGKVRFRMEELERSLTSMIRHCETLDTPAKRARREVDGYGYSYRSADNPYNAEDCQRQADLLKAKDLVRQIRPSPASSLL